jgi:hypothetical protein
VIAEKRRIRKLRRSQQNIPVDIRLNGCRRGDYVKKEGKQKTKRRKEKTKRVIVSKVFF